MLLFSSVVCTEVCSSVFSLLIPSMCLLHFRENAVHDETAPESAVQNGSSVRNGNLKTPVSGFLKIFKFFFNYGIYFLSHSIVTKLSIT